MSSRLHHIKDWTERAKQSNWCAKTLAQQCGVSLRTLERYFLKEKGRSPKKWILEQRREQAGKLLQTGTSVKETAGLLNYKHQNHLTNEFTRHMGSCPTSKARLFEP